jgi:ubiquinone/menaquinone biosynthesis C-methylase UbiE
VPDASVSHYIASLVLFMLPDAHAGLREAYRVLEPEGVMSCSSWKSAGWMELVMEARGKKGSDFKMPEMWAEVGSVRALLEDAGFVDVMVEEVTTYMKVEQADVLAGWFFGKDSPMAGMIQSMSEEERVQAMANLERLFEERKDPETGGIPGVGIVATGRKRGD